MFSTACKRRACCRVRQGSGPRRLGMRKTDTKLTDCRGSTIAYSIGKAPGPRRGGRHHHHQDGPVFDEGATRRGRSSPISDRSPAAALNRAKLPRKPCAESRSKNWRFTRGGGRVFTDWRVTLPFPAPRVLLHARRRQLFRLRAPFPASRPRAAAQSAEKVLATLLQDDRLILVAWSRRRLVSFLSAQPA
jgi:hypothetical protein